ncbi:MAG TPA: tetratricopeptide repeat protein [Stellaceae bacterium]
MSRLPKILITTGALAVILAGLYALSPYAVELSIENSCSLTKPDAACTKRMRWMGDAWSFKGNQERAQLWYGRAAAAGDVPAMFQLGWIYEMQAVDKLKALRAEWQQMRAAAPNPPPATEQLSPSGITRIDPAIAERVLGGGGPAGGQAAPVDAAAAHFRAGFAAMDADCRQSTEWYRRAADQGFAPAMNNLGELYFNGLAGSIGQPDRNEALRWYRAAAATGNPVGLWNVGVAYANGLGVARDPAEAAKWTTWYPSRKGLTVDLASAVLSRTTLLSQTLSSEQRDGLRAAAQAGTPFSIILPILDQVSRQRLG